MNIMLSNTSPHPIYLQIKDQIKQSILSGELAEGQLLPSIRSLAHDLQISVITTKRAYDDLEQEGLVQSVGGKGTFVSTQNKQLIREIQLQQIKEHIHEVVIESRKLGLSDKEIIALLQQFL